MMFVFEVCLKNLCARLEIVTLFVKKYEVCFWVRANLT